MPTDVVREDLRAVRRRQTRAAITEAAVGLALERGAAAVTVDRIAAAAGVSRRTFFNYFHAKEDALVHGPPPLAPEDAAAFAADTESSWLDALKWLMLRHVRQVMTERAEIVRSHRLVEGNPELLPVLLQRFEEFDRCLITVIEARAERVGHSLDAELVAAVVTAVVRVALQRWLHAPDGPDSGGKPSDLAASMSEALTTLRTTLLA
ncbi:TetR family transcriptional regulator [Streptomyces ruber]|uniref:TetR family transcriptional regulator n=2 Tax=Streptomyces TaxID=1883 RepID=A0A918ERU1_9ACTN|nr:TetR/AcrR family transcriptional regulator [Streptomyces ruber]GGQ53864.1 TetR family transcriptional regulator [Streptomyces ruber]